MKSLLLAAVLGALMTPAKAAQAADCTVTATGPTYWFDGRLYFHFDTTCAVAEPKITINATIVAPSGAKVVQTKTCTNATSCTYIVAQSYSRGTWTWTNDSTWPSGGGSAENTVLETQ